MENCVKKIIIYLTENKDNELREVNYDNSRFQINEVWKYVEYSESTPLQEKLGKQFNF